MKTFAKTLLHIASALLIFLLANAVAFAKLFQGAYFLIAVVPCYIFIHAEPSVFHLKLKTAKLRSLANGCELLRLFLFSTILTIVFNSMGIAGATPIEGIRNAPALWAGNVGLSIIIESLIFWNGIIRVYVTSAQLGIKWRVIGIVCGWIPVVHLIVLGKIIAISEAEVKLENHKLVVDETRVPEQICKTKYPILLVHGVFFRDWKFINYWGRIPAELEKNGAWIFYGNHQSALPVNESGAELAARIQEVLRVTGAKKVNIIAHSKGGLDSRYAISKCGMAPYVASLTTINTPHRGCEFADYLLSKISPGQQQKIAGAYNSTLKKLGDTNPDFLSAVCDLTAKRCKEINEQVPDSPTVFYQSVGSKLNHASGGRFPLNFSYQLVNYFDGDNDGLVGEKSFPWGKNYTFLTVKGKRGISHGDMIDMNRENFKGFDVREFYIQLVKKLKEQGF
ncbi:MAG: esterase/lipase family protein [Agathobacter sp.]